MCLKVGIIGCGKIGLLNDINEPDKKITYFSSLLKHEYFNLISVADIDQNKLRLVRIKNKKIKLYEDYVQMLTQNNLDIVIVSTPTRSHFEIYKHIANYKSVKVVIGEKPFLLNNFQYNTIDRIYKKKKIFLSINYSRKFNSSFFFLKKILEKIYLFQGEIIVNRGLYNNASHYINFMIQIFGKITSIKNVKITKSKFLDGDFYGQFELVFNKKINIHFNILDINNLSFERLLFFGKKNYLEIINDNLYIYDIIRKKNSLSILRNKAMHKINYKNSIENHLTNIKNFLKKKIKLKSPAKNAFLTSRVLKMIVDKNENK